MGSYFLLNLQLHAAFPVIWLYQFPRNPL